jgi:glycosyltransferase involved in cell wall biosynthesis
LIKNLIKDDYPILFDGLHTTYFINHPQLSHKIKIVRLHNIEHEYYNTLADYEKNLIKKAYFLLESIRLRSYEKVLKNADIVLSISETDQEHYYKMHYNSIFLAPFHPFLELESASGIGEYIIYHGDLSVNENSLIADSLISNVFSKVNYNCVIAGKNPPGYLQLHASAHKNISIVPNPDNDSMKKLIKDAQINLLPALRSNGFKLKLLMALFAGRHCIINTLATENSQIRGLVHIAESSEEIIKKLHILMNESFTVEMIHDRRRILSEYFDIRRNANKLIELIFGASK